MIIDKFYKVKANSKKQLNFLVITSRASDSVDNLSVLSNPADAQNVSCLRLCHRDICSKSYA